MVLSSKQIVFIIILAVTLVLYLFSESSINLPFLLNSKEFKDKNINDAIKRKYISTTELPGRLGNMIFRFASLYGIGRYLNRIPYYHGNYTSKKETCNSLYEIFPLLSEYVDIKLPQDYLIKVVNFTSNCCQYESPEKLKQYNNVKYLHIAESYLHSYKFFDQYQSDIKKLLECNQSIKTKAYNHTLSLWKNDMSSHKFCIHVRRSDFIQNTALQETLSEFVSPAAKYIFNDVRKTRIKNISLLMFGDDQDFLKAVNISDLQFTSVNILKNFTPEFDLCFAIEYCNTLLLSASASSYGWWAAYLKKGSGDVYYNANVTKNLLHGKSKYANDVFPPKWKKITQLKNGTIVAL